MEREKVLNKSCNEKNALAQMETASCCPEVWDNRYSVQLDTSETN